MNLLFPRLCYLWPRSTDWTEQPIREQGLPHVSSRRQSSGQARVSTEDSLQLRQSADDTLGNLKMSVKYLQTAAGIGTSVSFATEQLLMMLRNWPDGRSWYCPSVSVHCLSRDSGLSSSGTKWLPAQAGELLSSWASRISQGGRGPRPWALCKQFSVTLTWRVLSP